MADEAKNNKSIGDAEAVAALTEIVERHLPDCPAHFGGTEYDWVVRQYAALRKIARDALSLRSE